MNENAQPLVFSMTETLVMFGVLLVNAAAIWVRDNRHAFFGASLTILFGLGLTIFSIWAFRQAWADPFSFMVLVGLGMYIPYVAYHTTILERLIPLLRVKSNLGYLMYIVDAVGYLGYVGVIVYHDFGARPEDFLVFFLKLSLYLSLAGMACIVGALVYFRLQLTAG